jgi:hypothetical protein
MKNKLSYSFGLLLLIIAVASCKDVLDQKAVDSFTEESVFLDINVTKSYLGNCYDMMDGSGAKATNEPTLSGNKDLLASATDEMLNMQRPNQMVDIKGTISPDNLQAYNNNFFRFVQWTPLYSNIKNVNVLLANIDKVPVANTAEEKLRDRMKAEAYFIRAYDYAYLMRAYGGLVLVDKPFGLTDDFSTFKRSSLDETLDFVLADVDKAIAGLPLKNEIEQGRATKGAAAALKSKVLSWATGIVTNGGYLPADPLVSFQKGSRAARLTAAKLMAKDIMDGKYGHYALTGTTDDPPANMTEEVVMAYAENFYGIFNQKGIWNDEVMFGIQVKNKDGKQFDPNLSWGPNGYHGFGQNNPTESLVRKFEMKDGSPFAFGKYNPGSVNVRQFTAAELAADPEKNPYVGREPRFYASVLYDGAKWQARPKDLAAQDPEGRIQTGYFINASGASTAGLDTRQTTVEAWNGTKTGYYMKKYLDIKLDGQYSANENAWIEFRYAEVVLDYAEACIELNEVQEGLNALNMVRNRAGLPDRVTNDPGQARNWYRSERQVEFFGEGDRWYMIRKWMIAKDVITDLRQILIYHYADGSKKWQYDVATNIDARVWKDMAYWLPLPRAEMNKAPQLQPTPGYQ